jgi:serine/threonine protein kinase
MTQPDFKPRNLAQSETTRAALAGLNPMGLINAVLTDDNLDWQPPVAAELEALMKEEYVDFAFIDRGGMGAVYAATQKSLSRRVAIKVLPAELSTEENFVRLFEREGQMLGQLQHPHIVTVYGSGRTTAGHLYLVMEFVEGATLLEMLRKRRPSVTRALEITAQVCEALDYAHARGVVHLDIKPGNILIDERGLVRVADFGLSRDLRRLGSMTTTRKFIGTVGYAAPEQRRAEGIVDHRADIFSLGVTLYEMLTGQLPAGVFDLPSKKAGTSSKVDKIVLCALRENPEERYQSAAEMRTAIAKTMLRLGTPLVQRAIISRPMVSMMTCVIVGMSFIYLLGELSREFKLSNGVSALAAFDAPESLAEPALVKLDENWAVIQQDTRWSNLLGLVSHFPGWEAGEIHSEAEQKHVTKLLRENHMVRPLWLGARTVANSAPVRFEWFSGSPMTFRAMMPSRSMPPPIITEIQAKNKNSFHSKEGVSPDWIEIHNPSSQPCDLTGWHLRHYFGGQERGVYMSQAWIGRASDPELTSVILQPGEYRVIACSSRLPQMPGLIRIDFSLEATSGRLEWYDPQGIVCQRFEQNWLRFPEDTSIILAPDGESWGWSQKPTPGTPNNTITAPFAAPSIATHARPGLIMLPEFDGRWARCPAGISNQILLRRSKK